MLYFPPDPVSIIWLFSINFIIFTFSDYIRLWNKHSFSNKAEITVFGAIIPTPIFDTLPQKKFLENLLTLTSLQEFFSYVLLNSLSWASVNSIIPQPK